MFNIKDYWNEISDEYRIILLKSHDGKKSELKATAKKRYNMLSKKIKDHLDQEAKYIMNRVIEIKIDRDEG